MSIWKNASRRTIFYDLHLNIIRLGREVCGARKWECDRCPVESLCPFENKNLPSGGVNLTGAGQFPYLNPIYSDSSPIIDQGPVQRDVYQRLFAQQVLFAFPTKTQLVGGRYGRASAPGISLQRVRKRSLPGNGR